jgi:hypothetical protein
MDSRVLLDSSPWFASFKHGWEPVRVRARRREDPANWHLLRGNFGEFFYSSADLFLWGYQTELRNLGSGIWPNVSVSCMDQSLRGACRRRPFWYGGTRHFFLLDPCLARSSATINKRHVERQLGIIRNSVHEGWDTQGCTAGSMH